MPAPEYLFRFEQNIENALVASLAARGIVATAATAANYVQDSTGGTGTGSAPYVGVSSSSFDQASQQQAFAVNGSQFYNHFRGHVSVIIVTNRTAAGQALHHKQLGIVRAMMTRARQAFAPEAYEILKVTASSGSFVMLRDREYDRTELMYEIELGIIGARMDFAAADPAA